MHKYVREHSTSKGLCLQDDNNYNINNMRNSFKSNISKKRHNSIDLGINELGTIESYSREKIRFPFFYYIFAFMLNKSNSKYYSCIS